MKNIKKIEKIVKKLKKETSSEYTQLVKRILIKLLSQKFGYTENLKMKQKIPKITVIAMTISGAIFGPTRLPRSGCGRNYGHR